MPHLFEAITVISTSIRPAHSEELSLAAKNYDWEAGALLPDHTRRKHKVLREYWARYLSVRCQLPFQRRFRVACVDGFAGGGRYACGSPGSPVILLEELDRAARQINLQRAENGFPSIEIQCLLLLNDPHPAAFSSLKSSVEPLRESLSNDLSIDVRYSQQKFEDLYPHVKKVLAAGRYRNVLFYLDQCGHSDVDQRTLRDIIHSYPSAEIFYTFAIDALLAFLRKSEPARLDRQLAHLHLDHDDRSALDQVMSKNEWLGTAERIVFETFRSCAPFVSPFSINNPSGWRYWFIHLATSYRARQVYNDVLHENNSPQAHFGRAGLRMLSFDPQDARNLYLFDEDCRATAKDQLFDDIPRLLATLDGGIPVSTLYANIYNSTPAHAADIHSALVDNPDVIVGTKQGGKRRTPATITPDDFVLLERQRSFFSLARPPRA